VASLEQKINCRLGCNTHKNIRAIGLKTQENNDKYEQCRTQSQPREDTGLSLAEAVFGGQIVLPNELLQNDELSVDTIVKKFSKTLHVSAPSLPWHNSSTDLPSELPAKLFSTPLVWVHQGSLVLPLQPI
jgi:hypothetical protein